jgi:hypothetical protein
MIIRPSRRFAAAFGGLIAVGLAALLTSTVWSAGTARPSPAASLLVTAAARPAAQFVQPGAAVPGPPLPDSLAALQARVRRAPADWPAWSEIGGLQLEAGRATGEPTAYKAAAAAFDRSLRLHSAGNDLALAGEASLAASRHQFAAAERLARDALAINDSSAQALAALTDGLTGLGRYPEAQAAADRLDSLQPGVASFTRLSDQAELRGKAPAAIELMARAAQEASGAQQIAVTRSAEGLLRLAHGDLSGAGHAWEEGTAVAPGDPMLALLGARLAWAQGNQDLAVRRYADLVARRPATASAAAQAEALAALGRTREAASALAVARAGQLLARKAGIAPDSADVLFEADHGDRARAVALAADLWRRAPSVGEADAYAWALHCAGRDRDALGYANRALSLGGRPALMLAHRGMIRAALGDRAGALADLRAALETDRSFSALQAPRAAALLRRLETSS